MWGGVGLRSALRADVGVRQRYGMSVGEQPRTLARSQLSEDGAVVSGEDGFGCPALDISASEADLPRHHRTILAQLRSGQCSKVLTY